MKKKTNKRRKQMRSRRKFHSLLLVLCAAILVGMVITPRITAAESEASEPRYKYYTSIEIHGGDTLWSIAEEYITEEYASIYDYIDEVKEINHLSGDLIQAGNNICIPYYSDTYVE